jgi:FkbM family methyltransferase
MHWIDRFQPLLRASSLAPRGLQRRLFGNAMPDRVLNLKRLGFAPRRILDVGAYIGDWSDMARRVFPDAEVLMVEAQEGKRAVLDAMAARLGRARADIALVGAGDREVTFHELETGSSIYRELTDAPTVEVAKRTVSIDAVIARNGFDGVDFAKLDVQGAELEVLESGPGLLATAEVLLIEASVQAYNEGAPLIGEVMAYMEARGFRVFDMCEMRRSPTNDCVRQLDLLFARRDGQLAWLFGPTP